MPDPNQNCDAACVKIIIDTGMGYLAAYLYHRVLTDTPDVAAIDANAPLFYGEGVEEIFQKVALILNLYQLTDDQKERLAAQVNKECYRSDELITWSRDAAEYHAQHAGERTVEVFEWAKDNQTFYTAFAKEFEKE